MQQLSRLAAQAETRVLGKACQKLVCLLFTLGAIACGGAADRPDVQDVSGGSEPIVSAARPQAADVGADVEAQELTDPTATPNSTSESARVGATTPDPSLDSAAAEPCQHGTVVECKVWLNDVDCFTGLAVCDNGELSGCMDAAAAEAALELLD